MCCRIDLERNWHANGFSLVRQVLLGRYALDQHPSGLDASTGDELLWNRA